VEPKLSLTQKKKKKKNFYHVLCLQTKQRHFTPLKVHILEQQTCFNVTGIRCSQLPMLTSFLIKARFLAHIEGNNYENDLKRPYFPLAVQPSLSTSMSINF